MAMLEYEVGEKPQAVSICTVGEIGDRQDACPTEVRAGRAAIRM